MNIVAFSLYGNSLKYCEGMIRNAWLMPLIYPEWECHVWIDDAVPARYVAALTQMGVHLHPMTGIFAQKMFYRLLAHDLPGVDRYLVRDADSRISMRERRCVDQWMNSDQILHTIHDHPYHIRPIQGGTFGIWRGQDRITPNMAAVITARNWAARDRWGQDEDFLEAELWPRYKHSRMQHGRDLPIPAGQDEDPDAFVGEIRNENDGFIVEHRLMRKK